MNTVLAALAYAWRTMIPFALLLAITLFFAARHGGMRRAAVWVRGLSFAAPILDTALSACFD